MTRAAVRLDRRERPLRPSRHGPTGTLHPWRRARLAVRSARRSTRDAAARLAAVGLGADAPWSSRSPSSSCSRSSGWAPTRSREPIRRGGARSVRPVRRRRPSRRPRPPRSRPYTGWVDPASAFQPYYKAKIEGLLTFRGNPTRNYYGQGPVPTAPHVVWQYPGARDVLAVGGQGRDHQLVRDRLDRPAGRLRARRAHVGRVRRPTTAPIHFVDAATGQDILPPFPTGDIIKGSVTIDPDGFPLVYTGSRDNYYRVIAIDRPQATELWKLSATDVSPTKWNDDWDGSGLVLHDYLFEGGENSQMHVVKLNRAMGRRRARHRRAAARVARAGMGRRAHRQRRPGGLDRELGRDLGQHALLRELRRARAGMGHHAAVHRTARRRGRSGSGRATTPTPRSSSTKPGCCTSARSGSATTASRRPSGRCGSSTRPSPTTRSSGPSTTTAWPRPGCGGRRASSATSSSTRRTRGAPWASTAPPARSGGRSTSPAPLMGSPVIVDGEVDPGRLRRGPPRLRRLEHRRRSARGVAGAARELHRVDAGGLEGPDLRGHPGRVRARDRRRLTVTLHGRSLRSRVNRRSGACGEHPRRCHTPMGPSKHGNRARGSGGGVRGGGGRPARCVGGPVPGRRSTRPWPGRSSSSGRRWPARSATTRRVRAAVEQVVLTNREVMGHERELVGQDLATTRTVIDDQVRSMTDEVVRVQELVRELERDRQLKFGELTTAIQHSHEQLSVLAETTQGLRQALSSTKARGQWGERMADDVLPPARPRRGHQLPQAARDRRTGIPDFTFLLPDGLSLHMDVKFPLDNYLRYLDAESELDATPRPRRLPPRRARPRQDAREPRATATRPARPSTACSCSSRTRQLYAFIHEQDRTILDDALGQQARLLLAAHAVRGARGRPPGGRQLPGRADVRRDPRPARSVQQAVELVRREDGQARPLAEHRAQGLRRPHRYSAPPARARARQDRRPAPGERPRSGAATSPANRRSRSRPESRRRFGRRQ